MTPSIWINNISYFVGFNNANKKKIFIITKYYEEKNSGRETEASCRKVNNLYC